MRLFRNKHLTLAVLLAATLVAGQSTDAVCMPGWGWMINSRGQNPCLVSSYIIGVCEGAYSIPAIPSGDYYYVGPWRYEDNYCQCSTVTYSLMSACGLCQNATFLNWSSWSYNCTKDYPQQFTGDIPPGTSIPAWAYLDVLTQNQFNTIKAQQAAGLPESSAIATTLVTPVTSTSSTGTLLSATTATSTSAYHKKNSSIGPIVGGVVGGLVGLVLLVAFAMTMICYIRRRRQRAHTAPSAYATGYLNSPQTAAPLQYDSNRISHVPSMASRRPYDPADPSTFPTTPFTPNTVYTTAPPVPMLGYAGHNGRNATPML